jgi:hypothetical protein
MDIDSPVIFPTARRVAELDRLGDEIAELSAHLEAATARLLGGTSGSRLGDQRLASPGHARRETASVTRRVGISARS